MAVGDEKVSSAVKSFLNRQGLEYTEKEEQHATKLEIRSGAQRGSVNVYNSGKIVPGGPQGPLRKLLEDMKVAIETGTAVPGQMLPFELDKLPETIRARCPSCDPVVLRFVEEALRCYKADAFLGCAFLLGAASEKAVSQLIDAYGESISDPTNRGQFQQRIRARGMSQKYDEFQRSFKSCKTKPTDPLLNSDLDVFLGGMFQFCRVTRNEIGHPQIVPDLDKGVLLANLGHFAKYVERVYLLADFFRATSVVV